MQNLPTHEIAVLTVEAEHVEAHIDLALMLLDDKVLDELWAEFDQGDALEPYADLVAVAATGPQDGLAQWLKASVKDALAEALTVAIDGQDAVAFLLDDDEYGNRRIGELLWQAITSSGAPVPYVRFSVPQLAAA